MRHTQFGWLASVRAYLPGGGSTIFFQPNRPLGIRTSTCLSPASRSSRKSRSWTPLRLFNTRMNRPRGRVISTGSKPVGRIVTSSASSRSGAACPCGATGAVNSTTPAGVSHAHTVVAKTIIVTGIAANRVIPSLAGGTAGSLLCVIGENPLRYEELPPPASERALSNN
jgi:hypothetical protein